MAVFISTLLMVSRIPRGGPRRGIRNRQSGQSLVEVALLLPLLVLLLLGVIELGRYTYIGILVGNAAHAGALYGAQGNTQAGDTVGIAAAANNDFKSNGQGSSLSVASSYACGCDSAGTVAQQACSPAVCASGHWTVTVTVTASGTFTSLFNYPGIPSPITISRTSTMRVNIFGS